jgi:hypothetical protein
MTLEADGPPHRLHSPEVGEPGGDQVTVEREGGTVHIGFEEERARKFAPGGEAVGIGDR